MVCHLVDAGQVTDNVFVLRWWYVWEKWQSVGGGRLKGRTSLEGVGEREMGCIKYCR
jgi:hypothetical protein